MSNCVGHEADLPPALAELVAKARERMHPSTPTMRSSSMARARITPVDVNRPLSSLTVRELGEALGQPDIKAARELAARARATQQEACAAATTFSRSIAGLQGGATLMRCETVEEARSFFDQLIAAFAAPPQLALVCHACWIDPAGNVTAITANPKRQTAN